MKKSYQKGRGVEGSDGDGIKDLGLLQGSELLLSVAQNLLQKGLLPGVELQNLDSIQDLVHQPDAAIHELHLDLLLTTHKNEPASSEPSICEHEFTTVVFSPRTSQNMSALVRFYCWYISIKGNSKGPRMWSVHSRLVFD